MKKCIFAVLLIICALCACACGRVTGAILAPTMPGSTTPVEKAPTSKSEPTGTAPTDKPTDVPTSEPSTPTPTMEPQNSPTPTPTPTQAPTPTSSAGNGKIVVVLDPGHGGPWTGATSRGYVEAEINLKIAFYCKEYIEQHYPKLEVYMTRTENKTFSSDLPTDLKERIYFAKDKNAAVLVSLHLNAGGGLNGPGGCLICTQHQPQVKDEAARLGTLILEQLEALGIKSRSMSNGVRKGLYIRYSEDFFDEQGNPKEYYQICRNAANENLVGIIVEHCFIDSEADTKYYADDEAIRRLAIADAKGIAKYFGLE